MYYGLLGEHLPHSHSPKIHRLLGNRGYTLFEKKSDGLAPFFKNRKFYGLNVTIPYKEEVIKYCDTIDSIAAEIGAVNTVVNCGGSLFATNTDYDGFIFLCKYHKIDIKDKNVLILGSGGTSKTVRVAARDMGAKRVTVVSRSGDVNYENVFDKCADTNVIINTTPVGMYPNVDAKPIELSKFENLSGVIDVIYNPLCTRLLAEANFLGIPHANGLLMLVAQAAKADEYFRHTSHSNMEIVAIYKKIRRSLQNIVLIGMPGCGKSTVGRRVARILKREFVDTDAEIVARAGKSIPEIFADEGEEYFRNLEQSVTEDVCKRNGLAIALGGGTILREENRIAAKQNGKTVYLNRKIENLARRGRPLSSDDGAIQKLFEARSPIYESFADIKIDCREDLYSTVTQVLEETKK
ncbi:MAG: shikimate dehydrogenase [Clostridia bacterium]|nr:shikimate dehydrogenase [Clostridia bacterium]